jgi:tetratricopeptide (TPR) repeat protein
MKQNNEKLWTAGICAALAMVTFIAFEQLRHNDFVHYDDDTYVTENAHVKAGLTHESVTWAFTATHASNWHPATWFSHMLDCQLFGLNPAWHHFTNLLLHLINTLLLFLILKKMTGCLRPSLFIAAAFALHPLHVESVAWVAERKDVLSAFFWLLTMAAYIRYSNKPALSRYMLVLVCFCLALMAKPMVVTLPFVLLLLDYWPLDRFARTNQNQNQSSSKPVGIGKLILEKIPLLILSAASCVITYIAQQQSGTIAGIEQIPVAMRMSNAVVSYIRYIGKMFYPVRLVSLYPLPTNGWPPWQPIASLLLLIAVSVLVIYLARRCGWLLTGWLWYLGTLVPVIGLVQVGVQSMADRYTYLPSIGIFIMIAFTAAKVSQKQPAVRTILTVSAVCLCGIWLFCTRAQVKYWRDDITLFSRSLEMTENNYIMHNNLAINLAKSNRPAEAIEHYKKSLALRPNSPEIHNNKANALMRLNKIDEAIFHYEKAVKLKAGFVKFRLNLGAALNKKGDFDQAARHYRKCIELKPKNANAYNDLALMLVELGRVSEAIGYYETAIELKNDFFGARYNLCVALTEIEQYDRAIEQLNIIIAAHPDDADLYCNLGILFWHKGRTDEAVKACEKALQLDPAHARAKKYLRQIQAGKMTAR